MEFSKWLVSQREQRNWSQNKLAKKMNLSQAAVSRVEAGLIPPTSNFCIKLAEAFNIPVEQVFRAADILSQKSKRDELTDQATHLFDQIPTQEMKQMALQILEMFANQRK